MKRKLFSLFVLAISSQQLLMAADINLSTSFPDAKLRERIAYNYDNDKDGVLTDEEWGSITYLSLASEGIKDVTGIDLLTNLEWVNFSYNDITSLSLSKLVNLTSLSLDNNKNLTTVNLSGLTKLQSADFYDCALTSITLTNLPALESLNVSDNPGLTTLDVSKLSELKYLQAYNTGLKTIDVSGLTKLQNLNVYDCKDLTDITAKGCTVLDGISNLSDGYFPALKTITLTGNTVMTGFYAYGSELESLDLSGCANLEYIYAYDRPKLKTLKVDGCSSLTTLSAYNDKSLTTFSATGLDKLTSLDLYNCALTSVDVSNLPALQSLYVYDNPGLTTLDVSKLSELKYLQAYNTGLKTIDVSGLTKLQNLNVYDCKDLTDITAKGCTVLDGISNLSDGYFPALKTITLTGNTVMTGFYAYGSELESLDLSGCANLEYIYAYDRPKLKTLKVDGCSSLTTLSAYNDKSLTTFSATGLDKLTSLDLYNCALTSVDVSNLPALQSLYVYDNPGLTTLDVSKLSELKYLQAYNTGLKTIDVSGLTKLQNLNVYDCKDLTDITAKGCTVLDGISNLSDGYFPALKSITLTGSTEISGFSVYGGELESLDLSGCTVSYLYVENREKLTSINLDGCKIESLRIYNCDALAQLDLTKVTIKDLNISNNALLETVKLGKTEQFSFYDNEKLATIDVTALEGLTQVSSSYNNPALKSLDLSACKTLEQLTVYYNPNLETLLVNSPVLTYLSVYNNKLATIDVSNCAALKDFNCSQNQLTTLDVTKNTNLEYIDCSYNKLSSLDLSKNTKLSSANTSQYADYTLVKLSATEVGFPVSDTFDPASIEAGSFYNGYEYTEPTYAMVDGVRYFLVHNNAATVEEALKDHSVWYGYKTGNKDYPLQNNITVTGFTKAPSFLKVSAESVKGVYGAALAAPELTRSQAYNGTVSYKSANEAVVKVANDGKLTVVGAGETTVTVSGTEAEYRLAPADVTYAVTIEKASPVFKFNKAALEIIIKDEVPANALDKGVYDGTVVYKSSNEKVATIAKDGKVTVVAAGEVTFTASGAATKNCNEPTAASYKLTIKKRTATLTLAAASVEGVYGGKAEAPALTLNGYDGTVAYASSDEKVVKVAKDGKLTVVGAGEATVTISAPETANYYAPANVSYKVTIAKASPAFAFAKESVEANIFDAAPENKLTAGIYDGTVTYTSSDATVAEVDAKTGAVTLKKTGETKISVKGDATANCNGSTAEYLLKVIMITGDVNNDKKVDVTDVTMTIGYILGQNPEGFKAAAADVNNDEKVNITDVTLIIDIVLGK